MVQNDLKQHFMVLGLQHWRKCTALL